MGIVLIRYKLNIPFILSIFIHGDTFPVHCNWGRYHKSMFHETKPTLLLSTAGHLYERHGSNCQPSLLSRNPDDSCFCPFRPTTFRDWRRHADVVQIKAGIHLKSSESNTITPHSLFFLKRSVMSHFSNIEAFVFKVISQLVHTCVKAFPRGVNIEQYRCTGLKHILAFN